MSQKDADQKQTSRTQQKNEGWVSGHPPSQAVPRFDPQVPTVATRCQCGLNMIRRGAMPIIAVICPRLSSFLRIFLRFLTPI